MISSATPPGPPGLVTYDGRRFRTAGVESGEPSTQTATGLYHQDRDLVWAEFSGAAVRVGRLVGTSRTDGLIEAAYCLVTTEGETIAGTCVSTPTVLADGRMRLTEHWRRMDGSSGVSYLEEITE